jgi:hypothetical protein
MVSGLSKVKSLAVKVTTLGATGAAAVVSTFASCLVQLATATNNASVERRRSILHSEEMDENCWTRDDG